MKNAKRKPKGYWTKERCREEALKYKNSKELKQNSISCYSVIISKKWNDELFSHFNVIVSKPLNLTTLEYNRRWRLKNKDRIKEYAKKYYWNNLDKCRRSNRFKLFVKKKEFETRLTNINTARLIHCEILKENRGKFSLKTSEIPIELIEIKRKLIHTIRKIKNHGKQKNS